MSRSVFSPIAARCGFFRAATLFKQPGFTLIELMLVVVILAVIAAAAAPAFLDMIAKNQVKSAAEDVYGLLLQAKSEGPIRDSDMSFSVEGSGSLGWCVGFTDDSGGCTCTGETPTCAVNVAGTDVAQIVSGSEFDDVTLTGAGDVFLLPRSNLASGVANTLQVVSGDWGLNIIVSAEGRIIVCNPNDNTMPGYESCPT